VFRILPLQHTAIQLGPGPLAFGLDSAAALPSFAAFPRFFSLIVTPTSVHVSMSLGCNVEKSKGNILFQGTTHPRRTGGLQPSAGPARRLPRGTGGARCQ